jgi:hypothetical protein
MNLRSRTKHIQAQCISNITTNYADSNSVCSDSKSTTKDDVAVDTNAEATMIKVVWEMPEEPVKKQNHIVRCLALWFFFQSSSLSICRISEGPFLKGDCASLKIMILHRHFETYCKNKIKKSFALLCQIKWFVVAQTSSRTKAHSSNRAVARSPLNAAWFLRLRASALASTCLTSPMPDKESQLPTKQAEWKYL